MVSAMIRAIALGDVLEDYLDAKLNRRPFGRATVPSFLQDDPDFQRSSATGAESESSLRCCEHHHRYECERWQRRSKWTYIFSDFGINILALSWFLLGSSKGRTGSGCRVV